jgi:dTDP-4-dehydrorhamnose 3,5-epimerase-like enzyme
MHLFDPSSYTELHISKTDIPGLLVVALSIHGDARSWSKENFNREKMVQQGFPADFQITMHDIFYNAQRGATTGIHADPFEKYIGIAAGSAFAAVVDLRAGETFGKVLTFELNPGIALFIPKGCGSALQTLEDGTAYSHLMNAPRSAEAQRVSVALNDPTLNIQWPLPLEMAEISPKDKVNPLLKDIQPIEL